VRRRRSPCLGASTRTGPSAAGVAGTGAVRKEAEEATFVFLEKKC